MRAKFFRTQSTNRIYYDDWESAMRNLFSFKVAAFFALTSIATSASAIKLDQAYVNHGTANCQGALPSFDTSLRKRPMALSNEGNTDAFVTCDFDRIPNPTDDPGSYGDIAIAIANQSPVPVTLSCTLVNGFLGVGASFLTKSANTSSGQSAILQWSIDVDNGGERFVAPALSCKLPPGSQIVYVYSIYAEEVGN